MGCKKCGVKTNGYKCDICGAVASKHIESHGCGGEHCMAMCAGCEEAEVKCRC